ncbi:MAG TPA: ABC transporter ATP-binding protein [Phototrophicaceae bacterium]|nr:ABC transporter ATP-binding protein [Phototrophicaceae bacterium]
MSINERKIVQIRGLSKRYAEGGRTRAVLDHIDLDIMEGEFLVLLGKSGSGKSTLLNLLSGIDRADSGSISIDTIDITHLDERRLTLFRREHIGIIFQFFNLIPTLTILENVALPLELSGQTRGLSRARDLLAAVELDNRADAFPDALSGGEQQRVAIARALVNEPALVLADEPTGNLDEETGKQVLSLLLELTREAGRTLVMATHSPEIVPLADTVCRIHDHQLIITKRESVKELIS